MTLPAELGGGGANLQDFVLAQERLAQGDGPTAVAVNMHIFNVGVRSDLWRLGDVKQLPLLEACARDSLIICSGTSDPRMNTVVGFAGLNDTTRRAEKVNGRIPASMAAPASALSVYARISSNRPPTMTTPQKDPFACTLPCPPKPQASRSRTTGTP